MPCRDSAWAASVAERGRIGVARRAQKLPIKFDICPNTIQPAHKSVQKTDFTGKAPGTPKEKSVKNYVQWVEQHPSFREALADAKRNNFCIGDQFMNEVVTDAYRQLAQSKDPAVQYWLSRIDVLPPQPRRFIPDVDWLGPKKERSGIVQTPAGTTLGLIDRRADGVWDITPMTNGAVRVRARAKSQTDARCYLAQLLTVDVRVITANGEKNLRLVCADGPVAFRNLTPPSDDNPWLQSYSLEFWDDDHGIQSGQQIEVEVHDPNFPGSIETLRGNVIAISGHEIRVDGSTVIGLSTQQKRPTP